MKINLIITMLSDSSKVGKTTATEPRSGCRRMT